MNFNENPYNQTQVGETQDWSLQPGSASTYLTVVPAPPVDRTVPERLRDAYDRAPKLSDRELIDLAVAENRARAARAHEASHQAYIAVKGAPLYTDERPAYDAVIDEGVTAEDFDNAQHFQRLKVADRAVSEAETTAARAAARQAARCHVSGCGKLDVPTRLPIVPLTVSTGKPRPFPHNDKIEPGQTVVLHGSGPVCAECEAVIVAAYLADLAAAKLSRRRTRGEAARDYLATVKG